MSLKLTLAALALGLAAATDCCTYNPEGCDCATEPDAGCFKTGEEPFSRAQCRNGGEPPPDGTCTGGYRPSIPEEQCDPAEHPFGVPYTCKKDKFEADGFDTFCCGGYLHNCTKLIEEKPKITNLTECFKACAFNWCPGNGADSGYIRLPDVTDPDAVECLPITEEPTPAPVRGQFECPPEDVCPLGDASGCPEDKPLCCPVPPARRRRRLNFYPSTGCCQETCD